MAAGLPVAREHRILPYVFRCAIGMGISAHAFIFVMTMSVIRYKRPRIRRSKGFSLVELIAAAAVLVISGLGTLAAYLGSQQLIEHGVAMMRAADDLEDIVERIEDTAFETVMASFPDGEADGGDANDYEALVGGYVLQDEEIVVTYPSVQNGRLEIMATINWVFRGRLYSTSVSTLKIAEG
jgi:prepilin-type N-terminal cleavage/methylation domain-containing protein